MSVDYKAKAGYGVKIKNNLTEEYQIILEEKYDNDIYEFVENELSNFTYDCLGSCYSGDIEYILCSDKEDVLKYPEEFNAFKEKLEQNKHILKNIVPKWYCELYVS